MKTNKVSLLHRTDLFNGLREKLLIKAASLATSERLSQGQILFYENEQASGLYVVSAGELRSIRQDAGGREQILSIARPGAVLGLSALFGEGRFFRTAIADCAVEVFCIEKHDFHQLCRDDAGLLWKAARILANKIGEFAEVIESLALRSVEQRVAEYVVGIVEEHGTYTETSIVALPLSRGGIASRVGSAREVVSRAFTHLEERGLIRAEGRRLLSVPNVARLRQFAGIASRSNGLNRRQNDLSHDFIPLTITLPLSC